MRKGRKEDKINKLDGLNTRKISTVSFLIQPPRFLFLLTAPHSLPPCERDPA